MTNRESKKERTTQKYPAFEPQDHRHAFAPLGLPLASAVALEDSPHGSSSHWQLPLRVHLLDFQEGCHCRGTLVSVVQTFKPPSYTAELVQPPGRLLKDNTGKVEEFTIPLVNIRDGQENSCATISLTKPPPGQLQHLVFSLAGLPSGLCPLQVYPLLCVAELAEVFGEAGRCGADWRVAVEAGGGQAAGGDLPPALKHRVLSWVSSSSCSGARSDSPLSDKSKEGEVVGEEGRGAGDDGAVLNMALISSSILMASSS